MRFKNAVKLVFSNFGIIYKVLLYKVIVYLLLGIIGGLIVVPNFKDLVVGSKIGALVHSAWEVVRSIFTSGDLPAAQQAFTETLTFFNEYMAAHIDSMYVLLIVIGIMYFAGVFFSGVGDYAVGEVTDERMSSLANRGFCVCLFKNLGKACLFSLIDLAITFVFTAVSALIVVSLFVFTFKYIGVLTVCISIFVMTLLNALRKTFLTDFMPRLITEGNGISEAFTKSVRIKKKNFVRIFTNYFTINMVLFYLNISFAICTFFTGLIITLPITTILTLCFRFVNYYTLNGKKFYISYDEIITPMTASEDSVLMDKIDD